jgi:hypothetical protein
MSIHREDGEFVAVCECGNEITGGCEDNFRAFLREIRDAGWVISKGEGDKWLHTCPECQES